MDVEHHWKNTLVAVNTTILEAINKMTFSALRILLVVDSDTHLLGVITDGDIRRHLIKQGSLEACVDCIMRKNPVTATASENKNQLLRKLHEMGILHIPIVNADNCVVGLETFDSIYTKKSRENRVIFMAGGMGKRLQPLTDDCPKPLLKIGGKPISEILLESFIQCGFKNFHFSVNYKADMIRNHYGSGERWGVSIGYIEEKSALGTAGSLSLLDHIPDQSFFVVNADILTNINFGHIIDFHKEKKNNSGATMCVRLHQHVIPFGVAKVNEENNSLISIEEKPKKSCFINAGIYVLNPETLNYLPFNSYCDMPSFLKRLIENNVIVSTFPIQEYWLDIGHHENLVKAATDYVEVFS